MNKTFTDLHNQALTMGEKCGLCKGDNKETPCAYPEAARCLKVREAYEALERERDELAAYVEHLHEKLLDYAMGIDGFLYEEHNDDGKETEKEAREIIAKTPAQSLNHITEQPCCSEQALNELKAQIAERQCSELAAQVEEETIERNIEQIRNKIDSSSYDVVKDALEYIAELLEVQPRKYAKQAGSTVEDGE